MAKKAAKRILAITKASPKKAASKPQNPVVPEHNIIALMREEIFQSQIAIKDRISVNLDKIPLKLNLNITPYIDHIKKNQDKQSFNLNQALDLAESMWGKEAVKYIKYSLNGTLHNNSNMFLIPGTILIDNILKETAEVNAQLIVDRKKYSSTDNDNDRIYITYTEGTLFVNNSDFVDNYIKDTIILPKLKPQEIKEYIKKLTPVEIAHIYTGLQIVNSNSNHQPKRRIIHE